MSVDITIPQMGESVSEGTIATLLKETGSTVTQGDEIVEIETDKVNQMLYAPASGRLSLSVSAGDTVKVGQKIGSIEESEAPPPPEKKEAAPPKKEPSSGEARQFPGEYFESLQEKKAEPIAQQKAEPVAAPTGEGQTRKAMSGLRKTIAKRLVEVKNQTAMLTTFNEIDMSAIMAIREKEKAAFEKKYGVKLGFMSFFVKGCVSALKATPVINAYIDGNDIVYNDKLHIGIAVSTDRGLMVPVLRNCEDLSFSEIESHLSEQAKAAREGTISIDAIQGGTFTITNGGVFGSLLSTPILNPPQSGILGMHTIQKRPVVVDDEIVIRPMMYVALSYDHRIIDGREAVTFLVHLKEVLENPNKLLLEDCL